MVVDTLTPDRLLCNGSGYRVQAHADSRRVETCPRMTDFGRGQCPGDPPGTVVGSSCGGRMVDDFSARVARSVDRKAGGIGPFRARLTQWGAHAVA